MSDHPLLILAVVIVGVSFAAIGGANAVVPELHRQIVEVHRWMSSSEFAALYALAQAAPGPNVLAFSLIGWRVAGWMGFVVATAAMCIPPALLAYAVARIQTRFRRTRLMRSLQIGLVPIALGLVLASGFTLARAASDHVLDGVLVLLTTVLIAWTNVNPLVPLAIGALAGLLLPT